MRPQGFYRLCMATVQKRVVLWSSILTLTLLALQGPVVWAAGLPRQPAVDLQRFALSLAARIRSSCAKTLTCNVRSPWRLVRPSVMRDSAALQVVG